MLFCRLSWFDTVEEMRWRFHKAVARQVRQEMQNPTGWKGVWQVPEKFERLLEAAEKSSSGHDPRRQ